MSTQLALTNLASIEEVQDILSNMDGVSTILRRFGAHLDCLSFVQVRMHACHCTRVSGRWRFGACQRSAC